MKDEIKEIIELINTNYEDYYIEDFLSSEDVKKLVDYIVDLQEENKRLQKNLDFMIDRNLLKENKY